MTRLIILLSLILLGSTLPTLAQSQSTANDSTINNLTHAPEYETGELGAIPNFKKTGKGDETLILIPGWGFGTDVFQDFVEHYKEEYQMYIITIPGFDGTKAPPMPANNVSYGEQTWNNGVMNGLLNLIKEENISDPIIVGHSTQGTQLALRMANTYPEIIKTVIVLGGHPKFIAIQGGIEYDMNLNMRIKNTDEYLAPAWFKTLTKEAFDNGNYMPELYSTDSTLGQQLWQKCSNNPVPVMVQYICEFFASDVTLELESITCPVLVLRAMFDDEILSKSENNYVKPQFIKAWDTVDQLNANITVEDIYNSGVFVWKDQPEQVYQFINAFLSKR